MLSLVYYDNHIAVFYQISLDLYIWKFFSQIVAIYTNCETFFLMIFFSLSNLPQKTIL